MAIARKPKPQTDLPARGVDIDALIAKGGTVAGADTANGEGAAKFTLRVPVALLAQLDKHLKAHVIKTARQLWILEAIAAQLEREKA